MRTWIRQDEADRGERGDRPTTAEVEELRRLRKENLELRRANETSHALAGQAAVATVRGKAACSL
jgi:transposase